MTETFTYDFSYTGFSLRLPEMYKVAKAKRDQEPMDAVTEIGGGKTSTTKKFLNEINKRLDMLTRAQLEVLVEGNLTAQKQIAFLSICKVHAFIRDFVVEVLREKILLFDYLVTEGDYISFFRRKYDSHPEMESLTETSRKKIKQVTLKILEQAGLIDNIKTKMIQPQLLDARVIKVIVAENTDWLKLFLMSDTDIANVKK